MKIHNEIITGKSNPTVKWVSSLFDKKGRAESRSFVVEGVKLSVEAAEAGLNITHVILTESKKDELIDRLSVPFNAACHKDVQFVTVSDQIFNKLSTEKAPQGVITVIKYLDFFRDMDIIYNEAFFLSDDEKCIVLYSVRDPSNLGAVIRSSVAFGVDHIILSSDCADVYNPKTLRSAMGSIFRVRITTVSSMPDFITAMQARGRRVLAAELSDGALPLGELSLRSSDAVIIGNEGHGIPEEISSLCNNSVYIPISKKTESLNAAVAAALFMWELSKI